MRNPWLLGKKIWLDLKNKADYAKSAVKKNSVILVVLLLTSFGLILHIFAVQPVFYAQADTNKKVSGSARLQSPLFVGQSQVFAGEKSADKPATEPEVKKPEQVCGVGSAQFAKKLYGIVGDAPIKEMVPFISEREEKVAAFIVGIAKKESSFGSHSPFKDGSTCYNYWGYKGSAGRGSSMGYACFASAEEAVEIVGDRLEVLVNKNRTTPAIMVHTWKCGTNCAGDPGAPSWVSTVTTVFDKILS